MNADDIVLRELDSLVELERAEDFQREVWGQDDKADNADLMLALQHEGALVAGAFDGARMIGFVFGFPTRDPTRQHSHRLGVHPDSRGLGLGARLKWFQRDWCLERGIDTVAWTFDPLLGVNAALNIERLGGTAAVYHEDYYGAMPGINAGAPSDRLLVQWSLASSDVERLSRGEPREPRRDALLEIATPSASTAPASAPQASADVGPSDRSPAVVARVSTIVVPDDFTSMLVARPAAALAERLRVREELQDAFARGLQVTHFDRVTNRYTLTPRP